MDQHFNNNQHEFLWTLLANQANDAHLYESNLKLLVYDFPQSGILQALLAHASDEKNLKQASAYFNAKYLFKLINTPSAFTDVADEQIIIQSGISANGNRLLPATETFALLNAENGQHENLIKDDSAIEGKPKEWVQTDGKPAVEFEDHFQIEEDEIYEDDLAETLSAIENNNPVDQIAVEEHSPVLNEGAAVLINDEAVLNDHNSIKKVTEDTTYIPVIGEDEKQPETQVEENTFSEGEPLSIEQDKDQFDTYQGISLQNDKPDAASTSDEAEKLILENIANTDFFMFDRAFGEHRQKDEQENTPTTQQANNLDNTESINEEHKDVSNYYDEKMPYSFMWWLDKTRKEHAGLYQPYIKSQPRYYPFNKTKKPADELQQQYYENIFHITSLEELDKSTAHQTVEFNMKRKEHQIIERFIQEEPQIKPQSSDKIDNENKAKKSSEDRDELVTETLAIIYTEQMLYHKAIASYKKLMLKYPEKSSYFADKIEQIEKKIN